MALNKTDNKKNARLSRRGFLRSAAAAGAALAAPTIIPASALGAGRRLAPSERITLGFIGMGIQNNGHWGGFMGRSNTQLLACCDVESKRLEICRDRAETYYAQEKTKGTYKGCATYANYEDLLARDDIDAVVIATPDHWHALMAVRAAEAGKDVYCEKPLSLTIPQARAMVRAARRHGRVFQTGSQQRSESNFRLACEMALSGRIGKVHTVHVNVGDPSGPCYLSAEPTLATLDWNRWLGPAPWRPYNAILCPDHTRTYPLWRSYRDYSGGGMTDWGAHHFDIAQWGLGMDHTGPVEIIPPNGKDVDRLTYIYENGVVMTHGGAQGSAGTEFVGTEGRILVNRGYLETDPPSLMQEPLGAGDVHLYDSNDHGGDWLDCIRTRQKPICDVEIGARSVSVCHLGNIAYWTGLRLRWDPAKEEILNNPEATRWLERPMREPWVL